MNSRPLSSPRSVSLTKLPLVVLLAFMGSLLFSATALAQPVPRPAVPRPAKPPTFTGLDRSVIFTTPDPVALRRFIRSRSLIEPDADPDVTIKTDPERNPRVVGRTEDDNDEYYEYYDGNHYVAELRRGDDRPDAVAADAVDDDAILNTRRLTVVGALAGMQVTKYTGFDREHLVARLATEQGKYYLVDLGSTAHYDGLGLDVGDAMQVVGRLGTIDGTPAIVAESVKVRDRAIDVIR